MSKSLIVLRLKVFLIRCQLQILYWKRDNLKKKIARINYLMREVNRK